MEKTAQKNYEQCFAVNLWITYQKQGKLHVSPKTKKWPRIQPRSVML